MRLQGVSKKTKEKDRNQGSKREGGRNNGKERKQRKISRGGGRENERCNQTKRSKDAKKST